MKEYNGYEMTQRLNKCIKESGLTRAEISSQYKIPKATIDSHCANGKDNCKITSEILYKYSKALNVSIDYLVSGEDNVLSRQFNEITQEKILYAFVVMIEAFGAKAFSTEYDSYGVSKSLTFKWFDPELLEKIQLLINLSTIKNSAFTPAEYEKKVQEICKKEDINLFNGILKKNLTQAEEHEEWANQCEEEIPEEYQQYMEDFYE